MPQRLFSVPKVPLFLDDYAPGMERRKDGEVKILTLTLRVQPFDAKLATAIDDGVGGDSNVRATLFKLNHPDPKPHLARVQFTLDCPRQNLVVFASTDTAQSRIAFAQAKIAGVYVRTQKDIGGYALIFKASFGPVGRAEQEYIHDWMLTQRAVTFEEAEPSMAFEPARDGDDEDGEITDADEKSRRPPPMFDTDAGGRVTELEGQPIDAPEPARKGLHVHGGGKKKTAGGRRR